MKWLLTWLFILTPVVANATDAKLYGSMPTILKYRDSQGRDCETKKYDNGTVQTDCLAYIDKWKDPVIEKKTKDILLPYNDFLTILADKERMTALLKQATDQNRILVKLTDEQGTTITLQAKQIARCESIMRDMDQLGKTDSEIARVVAEQLQQELRESREQNVWSFGGGIGVGVLIGAALMWLF